MPTRHYDLGFGEDCDEFSILCNGCGAVGQSVDGVWNCDEPTEEAEFKELLPRVIRAWNVRTASGKAEERDFTPEEALAEAIKRWGQDGKVSVDLWWGNSKSGEEKYRVGVCRERGVRGCGNSFREAFAKADKESTR
jgi:hypothetical protein